MANLNKVMLIGRLTRDPEVKDFEDGGRVVNVGFAVHNRRKNPDTGQWMDVPVWLNLKAFNRLHGRPLADLAAKLHKGRQVYVEGHLALEEWTGKEDGKHHSKTLVYVDAIEFMGGAHKPGAAHAEAQGGTQPAEQTGAAQVEAAAARTDEPYSAASTETGQASAPAPEAAQADAAGAKPPAPARARRKR